MAVTTLAPRTDQMVDQIAEEAIRLYALFGQRPDIKSLTRSCERLADLGPGRLFVSLPPGISPAFVHQTMNKVAIKQGRLPLYYDEPSWGPIAKLASTPIGPPRLSLALFNEAPQADVDPLLHFAGVPYDTRRKRRPNELPQVDLVKAKQHSFKRAHPTTHLRVGSWHDFAAWNLTDVINEIATPNMALVNGGMRLPGRRVVDKIPVIRCVGVSPQVGHAYFGWSHGCASKAGNGIGLVATVE